MRITWITNIPTPYRVALWNALMVRCDLDVITMSATLPNRHWDGADLLRQVNGISVNAPTLHLANDLTIFLPNRALRAVMESCGDVAVIDGWESPSYQYAGWKARRSGAAVVSYYQSTMNSHRFARGLVARVRSELIRSADAVITGGPASREALVEMGVADERIFDGLNVVEIDAFVRPSSMAPHRHGGHMFVYVGQLVERKNVHSLITAMSMLPANTELVIVGDGPLRKSLYDLSRSLWLGERVRFIGRASQNEVIDLLHRDAQTLVLPSTREVYGLVVPEALAAGLHCVVSAACGVALSVAQMRGVYICEPTPEEMSAAMLRSCHEWNGYIESPEVLRHTPEALADVVIKAAVSVASAGG